MFPPPPSAPRPVPRPLAELPDAALAGLQGLLTDIDDTLTRDGAIEPPALAALHALHAAGIPVVAITGRPAGWSEPMVRDWPVVAIVAENGGVLLTRDAAAPDGLRRRFTVDDSTRAARFERLQACAQAVLAEVPGSTLARDSAGRLTDIAVDHSEFAHLPAAQIDAVVALMQRHGLNATVSSIHVNGWLGGHSKWTGAQWAVTEVLGRPFDEADWAYVGDSLNDQAMFARMPLGIGVANIVPLLPRIDWPPGWVTEAERGAGFAEFAARVAAARGHVVPA